MRRQILALLLLTCGVSAAQVAPIPALGEIGGRPYSIRDKWVIGGEGSWDYLTLDPQVRRLYVTHNGLVDVVDLESGSLVGEVGPFGNARNVALDASGQWGYVSDSLRNAIAVFDRRTLHIEKVIQLACPPRSIAVIPDQPLVVAVCIAPTPEQEDAEAQREAWKRWGGRRPHVPFLPLRRAPAGYSWLAVVDTDARAPLVYLLAAGDFRIAQADNEGNLYVTVGPAKDSRDYFYGSPRELKPAIARVDVGEIAAEVRRSGEYKPGDAHHPASVPTWETTGPNSARVEYFYLHDGCSQPRGLALDSRDHRLFVACEDQALLVLDSARGSVLTSLTIGPGADQVVWDEKDGLIFTANGGGYGSVSVVVRHETDTYAVIQNLPTMERAHTMAVDSSTGDVYLVTDLHGAALPNPPANGIGTLRLRPVAGSFQVLVIGN